MSLRLGRERLCGRIDELARSDDGVIGTSGHLDQQRVCLPLTSVVLGEAGAKTPSFDAHRVVDGRVVGVTTEDVEGNDVLLERLVLMGECVLDDVAKEEPAAMRAAECM